MNRANWRRNAIVGMVNTNAVNTAVNTNDSTSELWRYVILISRYKVNQLLT